MLLVAIFCLVWTQAHAQNPVVQTEYGPVQGQTVPVLFDDVITDVNTYWAIPYTAPPTGARRFQRPEKAEPWSLFVADTLGSACPQDPVGVTWITHPLWTDYDEDCLNLNIFAPAVPGSYPVMVWFYGGGFTQGSNINYPGHFLAAQGVVMVVVNYRVGNLGFPFSGGDGFFPGNQGMWDQVMALEFVRDNIAGFNGDPNMVTIFGQSAGAASASLHMVSPVSKDLFHQAILHSGTESNFWSMNWPGQQPTNYLYDVAEQNGCPTENHQDLLLCMQDLPWQQLYNTSFECRPGFFCQGMAPVVDGIFLPKTPPELREDGDINTGPIITGITRDDGSLYTQQLIPEADDGGFNKSAFHFYMRDRLLGIWDPQWDELTTEDVFQAVVWRYTDWPFEDDEDRNRNSFNEMITDAAFGAPANRQALLHSELQPDVYTYVYDYKGENTTAVFPDWMGVPHMADIPYVVCLPLLKDNPDVREDCRIFVDVVDWTEEDKAHCIYFSTLLTNFAKTGNPTPEPVPDPVGGFTTWEPYSDESRNVLYVSNDDPHLETNYRQHEYAFWLYYFDYLKGDADIPIRMDDTRVGLQSDWSTRAMHDMIEELYDDFV